MIQSRFEPLEGSFSIQELQCYNLPFGGLGLISHVLTYYTIGCLWYGKRPLWPFRKMTSANYDIGLNLGQLIGCIIASIPTIVQCKNTRQLHLLFIAVWNLCMSVFNGLTALHVACLIFRKTDLNPVDPRVTKQAAWWLVLCE